MVSKLLSDLKAAGITLKAKGDKLSFAAPKGRMTPALLDQVRAYKNDLLDCINRKDSHKDLTNSIIHGDCRDVMAEIPDNSIDVVITDPPYGYGFMGKGWDKALPDVSIWGECCRVMKPGAFAFIFAAPRQDVLSRMIVRLEDAGFVTGFTSLYWTYASGFPKAHNISKAIDKKFGATRVVVSERAMPDMRGNNYGQSDRDYTATIVQDTLPATAEAKALDGSYAGFQPKPAVEVILVVMKPVAEKNYTEQALKSGKGVTWLDDCRIPYGDELPSIGNRHRHDRGEGYGFKAPWQQKGGVQWSPEKHWKQDIERAAHEKGRFPANLLVSDDILDDGRPHKSSPMDCIAKNESGVCYGKFNPQRAYNKGDTGDYSRFFSLDLWAERNLPFLIVPKASPKEKNAGLDPANRNIHPTVKPFKLMAYLVTMGSRPGDIVLDPFAGSGTTLIAANMLDRRFVGIELEQEYFEIAAQRMSHHAVNNIKNYRRTTK